MSSDKRKGKVQALKAPSRQRTLLDSFVTRVPSKAAPLEPVAGNMLPPATTDLQLGKSSNSLEKATNIIEDLDKIASGDSPCSPCLEDNGRRSPSIVIIEDTQDSLRETPHITSQGYGSAKDLPIIIDASPVKCRSSFKKPIHPFFLPKSTRAIGGPQIHPVPLEKKAADTAMPPNPSLFYPRGIPQHVRGLQTTFTCSYSPLPTRPHYTCEQATDRVSNYAFLKSPTIVDKPLSLSPTVQLLPIGDNDPANGIPEDIKASYPAVARLLDLKPADKPTSNRPWADRWRPSCAHEVLGNEQSAIYLRDWLSSLELQLEESGANFAHTGSVGDHRKVEVKKTITRGIKRPRVIRAVDKTRRKRTRLDSDDEEDNWIVYTDEEDDDDVQINCDQFDEFGEIIVNDLPTSSPSSSVQESSQQATEKDEQLSSLGQLHNTILLTGPPGCGKTASVYACAEELGWDVFEVYPGIGRRNASNMENLIGEVGKNHLVLQNRTSGDSLKSFLQSKAKRKTTDDNEEYNALSHISPRKKSTMEMNFEEECVKSVQQSLILLEEVDILFKEDTNFWTTVTKIIRECKRPVVCTCNDLSLVPVQDLPLQATLFYAPCPEGPAACYLQALCAAEGYAANWKDLVTLYCSPRRTLSAVNDTPDLRATINALQAISADALASRVEEAESGSTGISLVRPRISVRDSEFVSFVDGSLERDIHTDLCSHVPSEDDETGHIILSDRHAEDGAMYGRHREILSAAAGLVNPDSGMESGMAKRGRECREGQSVAGREICRVGSDAVAVSLEYLPYARQIVAAEDRLEREEQEKGAGRRTRNSTRRQYVRVVDLTEQARDGVMRGLEW